MSAVSYNVDALNGGLAGHIPILFLPALRHARFQLTELNGNISLCALSPIKYQKI